ncbi:hypothetical protein [Arthrobacter sp. NyZ413]|uniref:hypothetical protein n=1 Tax=Arthrobacter sp. NyZ413 TaxID=3144669 RepID=UPI003BF8D729
MGLLNGRRGGLQRVNFRHSRAEGHVEECSECQAAVLRERQYLERLRRASVPEASQDFTNRLIEHTRRLAESDDAGQPASERRPWQNMRIAGAAAGGLAVSAGILAVAAYVLGGEATPQASNAGEQEVRTLVSSTSAANLPDQLPMTSPQANLPVTVSASVALNPQQLSELRKEGWACPELDSMGFHVVGARAMMQDGHPAVELQLDNGAHHATLTEEHLEGSGSTGTRLSTSPGTPWQAVYTSPVAVLRYSSDMPPEQAASALPELVKAGDGLLARPAQDTSESWNERVQRGLRTLAGLAGF